MNLTGQTISAGCHPRSTTHWVRGQCGENQLQSNPCRAKAEVLSGSWWDLMSHHHWTRVLQNVGVGRTGLNSGDLVRIEWFLLEVTLQMRMLRKLVWENSIYYAYFCSSSACFEKQNSCAEITLQQTGFSLLLGEREIIKTQPCDKLRVHKAF